MSETEAGLSIDALPDQVQANLEGRDPVSTAIALGLGGEQTSDWDVPTLQLRPSDKPIRKGNAGIVIGKDRENTIFSGFGGKASNGRCAAIDIVAGHQAFLAEASPLPVNPDFKLDAARIYISH